MNLSGTGNRRRQKQIFVSTNQILIDEYSINYQNSINLTDSIIEQILLDIDEQKKKKQAEFREGVKNGTIKVDYFPFLNRPA